MDIAPDNRISMVFFANTVYYIDFYQRDYKWTEEPVTDCWMTFSNKFNQNTRSAKILRLLKKPLPPDIPGTT
jgi:uncharacterized protein with ParB-like and HNH nuclease domain